MAKSAKAKNVFDVTSIIPEKQPRKTDASYTDEIQEENTQNTYIKLLHQQNTEKRDKRMQVVIKPSTFAYLEQMQKNGKIKSKNDFINSLLEDFIKQTK